MEIKPIRMTINAGLDKSEDSSLPLEEHFRTAVDAIQAASREQLTGAAHGVASDTETLLAVSGAFLALMRQLDREYGADGRLPMEDATDAVDAALRSLAELESWLIRFDLPEKLVNLHTVEIGVGFWAMRHAVPITLVEPIVNALAAKSNSAMSKQEMAAVFAMMQGFIQHISTGHEADLERSNPQRPWRLLNLNFAITAIKTGDLDLMRFAFDRLNQYLPDERTGFYAEAHSVASQPGFPANTRHLIETEIARWTRVH
ncbi:MAG: hypothetical protein ABI583_11070 [Betaproteobacteria bacterium]